MKSQFIEGRPSSANLLTRRELLQLTRVIMTGLGAYGVRNFLKKYFPGEEITNKQLPITQTISSPQIQALPTSQLSPKIDPTPVIRKELENSQGIILTVEPLSQQDPRWAGKNIGNNNPAEGYTIGAYGCLITALSMYLRAAGEPDMTPDLVNKKLKNNHGYQPGSGLFDINTGPKALGLQQAGTSIYYEGPVNKKGLKFVQEHIIDGQPILAKVDMYLNTSVTEEHYVLVTGISRDAQGNFLYTYADSWDGQVYTVNEPTFARKGVQFFAFDKKLSPQSIEIKDLQVAIAGQTAPDIEPTDDELKEPTSNLGLNFDESITLQGNFPKKVNQWAPQINYFTRKRAEKLGISLPPELVASLINIESGGDPESHSRCEAIGLMQVMPSDGDKSNECYGPVSHYFIKRPTKADLKDPVFNIKYGTGMLARLTKQNNGNIREALKNYGPMNVGYYYSDLVLNTWKKNSPQTYKEYSKH